MSIAAINVNCLLCNIYKICLVKDLGIHILVMNKTNIDDKIEGNLVSIEYYSIKRNYRNHNAVGVAAYVQDSPFNKITIRLDLPLFDLEGVLKLKSTKAEPILVVSWYSPSDG